MASNEPKPSKGNLRRKEISPMSGNQTTIIYIGITNYGTINGSPSEPPPGNHRSWLIAAIRAILRMVPIIWL